MVYETTLLQMPAAEDALHSKSKNVPHRIDTVGTGNGIMYLANSVTSRIWIYIFTVLHTHCDLGLIKQLEKRLGDLGLRPPDTLIGSNTRADILDLQFLV